jgi:hypothetical protein
MKNEAGVKEEVATLKKMAENWRRWQKTGGEGSRLG